MGYGYYDIADCTPPTDCKEYQCDAYELAVSALGGYSWALTDNPGGAGTGPAIPLIGGITLDPHTSPSLGEIPIMDVCGPETSGAWGSNSNWRDTHVSGAVPVTLQGSFSLVADSDNDVRLVRLGFYNDDWTAVTFNVDYDGSFLAEMKSFKAGGGPAEVSTASWPAANPAAPSVIAFSYDFTEGTGAWSVTAYSDGVNLGTKTGTLPGGAVWQINSSNYTVIGGAGAGNIHANYVRIGNDQMSEEQYMTLHDAFNQNFTGYVDPGPCGEIPWSPLCENPVTGWTPNYPCFDPNITPTLLYQYGTSWAGFGQDCLISDGVTETGEWMINPKGYDGMEITYDNGATFAWFQANGATPRVNLRMILQSDNTWNILLYRDDVREPTPYFGTVGSWNLYGAGNQLMYNHGFAVEGVGSGSKTYLMDSNNNGNGNPWIYEGYNPSPASITKTAGAQIPNTGPSSWWHVYLVGSQIFAARDGQGIFTTKYYSVMDKATLATVTENVVVYSGRTSASSGNSIKSSGDIASGAISGATAKIQTWGTGSVTEDTWTFPAAVEDAHMHYGNGHYVITAVDAADPSKMYFGDLSLGRTSEIALPFPNDGYPYRSVRYVGGGEWIMAYLATTAVIKDFTLVKFTL